MTREKQMDSQFLLTDLAKSGLTEGHARRLRIKATGPDNYEIPYFDLNGKVTGFFRTKHFYSDEYLGKLKKAKKKCPPKYTQSAGTQPEIYLPPLLDEPWSKIVDDPTIALVLTEGEKKSACACANGIPCIGLGGTWSWRSRKLAMQILPALNKVAWNDRVVRVLLDSDCVANDSARKGGEWLVAELNNRGAKAVLVILPPDGDAKVALDDYLVRHGAEALMNALAEPTSLQSEPWLEDLNRKLAVIKATGEFIALDTGIVYGNTALRNLYSKFGNLNTWIKWPQQREVKKLIFAPGEPSGVTPASDYNTWPGWNVEPTKCAAKDVQPWHDLMRRVLPETTETERRWVACWFGYPIKHPGAKLNTALLVWSIAHGTGKNALAETLRHIYGSAWGTVDGSALGSQFNEWAICKQFVVADELHVGDKRGLTNKLKDMITRTRLRVNSKNQRTYEVDDHINYFLTSNHPDAMYVEDYDRRMAIFHASEEQLLVAEWEKYDAWLKSGGAAALRYYFENVLDYSAFNPLEAAPVTAAKREMIEAGRSDVEVWIAELKRNPDAVLTTSYDLYRSMDLHRAYDPHGREHIKLNGFATKLGVARVPKISHNKTLIQGARSWLWVVRGDAKMYERLTPKQLAEAYVTERSDKGALATSTRAKRLGKPT